MFHLNCISQRYIFCRDIFLNNQPWHYFVIKVCVTTIMGKCEIILSNKNILLRDRKGSLSGGGNNPVLSRVPLGYRSDWGANLAAGLNGVPAEERTLDHPSSTHVPKILPSPSFGCGIKSR